MSVATILEEVQELTRKLEEQKKALVAKIKPEFHNIFKPFLEEHPEVERLEFHAYTPYFNDGEPCEYEVRDLHGFFGGEDECEYEGSLPAWSKHYAALLEYKQTGVINDELKRHYTYYTKPSSRYDSSSRSYVPTSAQYATIEDAIRVQCRETLSLSIEELEAKAKLEKDFLEVRNVFGSIPDDIIYDLFGDHIRVVITREGVEVEEYDHD